jgi:hypothetical protein
VFSCCGPALATLPEQRGERRRVCARTPAAVQGGCLRGRQRRSSQQCSSPPHTTPTDLISPQEFPKAARSHQPPHDLAPTRPVPRPTRPHSSAGRKLRQGFCAAYALSRCCLSAACLPFGLPASLLSWAGSSVPPCCGAGQGSGLWSQPSHSPGLRHLCSQAPQAQAKGPRVGSPEWKCCAKER